MTLDSYRRENHTGTGESANKKTESTSLQTFETFIGQEAESKTSGTLQTFETSMLTQVAIQLPDWVYCLARMPSFQSSFQHASQTLKATIIKKSYCFKLDAGTWHTFPEEKGLKEFGIPSIVPLSQLPKARESVYPCLFNVDKCAIAKVQVVLTQLELWHPPKNVVKILLGLCRVYNLVAAISQTFLHYTVCYLLVKPAMPTSFRHWTCIKQEPGTENFNTCRKNPSPKADQQWLFSFTYPSMVLLKQLCLLHATLCDFLIVEKNSLKVVFWIWQIASCLGSTWTLAHLAEALQSFQSGGCHNSDISPLYRLWPASQAYNASIIQVLELDQTRAWHWKLQHLSEKSVSESGPTMAISFTYPSMVLFQQLCLFHATLCDFLIVEKNSLKVVFWIWQIASCLGSTWTLAHLAEALQSLQSGGCHNSDISPLYRLWPASQA